MFNFNIISVVLAGRNKTYLEALDACAREHSSLPIADTVDAHQNLLDKMKALNLTTVWLRLYRQDLETHQWSDKTVLSMSKN